ncbi:hypothetical protein BpHYR1_045833 [Brachionus plicatilis]|uniref:Uncharacterized protein n=1 Tax=Brachionus plicatilis TaxID=10195 RepID=A0A3M7RQJ8_BRAPC|nr:hypothetical protein BpHYR1_045833 [Brachionus plicatilis]
MTDYSKINRTKELQSFLYSYRRYIGGDPRARPNGSRPSFGPALKRKIDINLDDQIKLEKKIKT